MKKKLRESDFFSLPSFQFLFSQRPRASSFCLPFRAPARRHTRARPWAEERGSRAQSRRRKSERKRAEKRRASMEEKKKKGRRRNKKKGANGISGPQALFCTAAQHATTQLLESTSCCARWCREKGARRSDRRVCKGGRADSFPPQP